MLLKQGFIKYLGINIGICSVLLFASCETARNFHGKQREIIPYTFPAKVDSLLVSFYRTVNNNPDSMKQEPYLVLSRYTVDNDTNIYYYLRVDKIYELDSKCIVFEELDDETKYKYLDYFILSRTHRYAVINNGEFKIPLKMGEDDMWVGYDAISPADLRRRARDIDDAPCFILFTDTGLVVTSYHFRKEP